MRREMNSQECKSSHPYYRGTQALQEASYNHEPIGGGKHEHNLGPYKGNQPDYERYLPVVISLGQMCNRRSD